MALPKIMKNIDARLKISGGTATGPIQFDYNYYQGEIGPGFFLRFNDSSKNSYGYLQILDNSQELKNRVRFFDYDGSKQTSYDIYGEHNKPNATDIGALALTGGTLIGSLEIKSAYPALISTNTTTGQSMRLYHSSNSVILVNRNLAEDSTNYRALYLHNSKGASSASNALVLQDCINGAATNHTLLHSGNYIYTLDGAYTKSVALEYEQFDTLTDLGYATKNYCGYASSGHLFVGREWGRDASGKNFGYQLRVSGWDGTLYTRSFDGWGTSWSQWYQYYSTRNIQKGSSSVPSLLPEDGIYIKY